MATQESTETGSVKEPGPTKRPYILKQGQKHFISTKDGNIRLAAGQTAYLTDAQFSAFKDKFDPAKETKKQIEDRATKDATEQFSMVHVGARKYNVVNNSSGNVLNDEPMTGPAAKKLQAKLEAGKAKAKDTGAKASEVDTKGQDGSEPDETKD